LKYIELGNEERVDDNYFEKFKAVPTWIFGEDPHIFDFRRFVLSQGNHRPRSIYRADSG